MQVSKLLARLFVAVFLAVLIFRPMAVNAQGSPEGVDTAFCTANPSDPACNRAVGDQNITPQDIAAAINSPTPNLANTTAYVFYTITVLLTGTFDPEIAGSTPTATDIPVDPGDARGPDNPRPGSTSYFPSSVNNAISQDGLIGGISYLTASMIKNPPASAGEYVVDVVRDSRFAPDSAYAQAPGLGFGALNPILGTWKAFRNVSYYLLILIGFVVGFLVLIRQKVSGNVAVTVQNALPRIVITIILITFSYAIAGLVVDVLFLSIYFIINIFGNNIFVENARFLGNMFQDGGQSLSDIAFNTHIFQFTINYIFNGQAWNAARSVGDILYTAIGGVSGFFQFVTDVDKVVGGPIQWLVRQIFALIFAIAIFIAMFRTFFSLVMSYAGFVINVVMAPFILLPGVIPGNNPFSNWIKNLVAGLAPFAVAIFMIFMAFALTGEQTRDDIGYKNIENPEDMVGLRLPLIMSGADTSAFVGILAMGFILLLPEAVNMTKKALGASGGMFDEFKDKAVANLQQGLNGNKYVPGAKKVAPIVGGVAVTGAALGVGGAAYGAARGFQQPVNKADLPTGMIADRMPESVRTAYVRANRAGTQAIKGSAAGISTGLISPAVLGGTAMVGKFANEKITPRIHGLNEGLRGARDLRNSSQGSEANRDAAQPTVVPNTGAPGATIKAAEEPF